ncbi:MAG: polymerase, sigma-24 subunit, subfamily [Nocardioides sp.]|nr:polymerase, sigma-24 subunit, subfamily [Nocardioides sp.]
MYARAAGPLIGLLTVIGDSRPDAEEVTQDAFVRLLEHWPKVRDYDDVDAWLRTVAVRLLISRRRRGAVARVGLQRLAARTNDATDRADGSDGHEGVGVDLAAALAALPVAHRAVLVLHHVHDLPVAEVATLLDIPVGTVKSRLGRARASIAPHLNERTTP